jgi:hypothetical protein
MINHFNLLYPTLRNVKAVFDSSHFKFYLSFLSAPTLGLLVLAQNVHALQHFLR